MTKTSLSITLDSKVKAELEKRAKKELLSVEDLISDILRRSILSYKGTTKDTDKVDDKFLTFFSRKAKKYSKKNYVR